MLFIFSVYALLDTFLITRVYQEVDSIDNNNISLNVGDVKSSDTYYEDDNIKINLTAYREYNTTIYVADVYGNIEYLKTEFAKNSYGKNVTEKTSSMASRVNAILAVNGDYYGARNKGYVLRNGVIYRDSAQINQEDLVIYSDGSMEIINESDITLEELKNKGAYNVLSFGPGLIMNGEIIISETDEVDRSMASNPRTAIGKIDDNHYVFVVSDGRTDESAGLSLCELATFMKELGCDILYNLDGGGSSTMYFNEEVVNNPTTSGRGISERSVSDIVYIGY